MSGGRGQGAPLAPCGIEVLCRQPTPEAGIHTWPLVIQQAEPGGVAVAALDHPVLAKQAFMAEAQALGGSLRARIGVIALPFQATIAQGEGLLHQEVKGFGGQGCALQTSAKGDMANLDAAMFGDDTHQAELTQGTSVLGIHHGIEQRIATLGETRQPGGEGGLIGEGPLR